MDVSISGTHNFNLFNWLITLQLMTANNKTTLTIDQARKKLRSANLRCTPTRIAVLRLLSGTENPLTHKEVEKRLAPKGLDKTTLYRCLVDLSDAGLVNRIELGDHLWRFTIHGCEDQKTFSHPHFLCIECGKVECLPHVEISLSTNGEGNAKSGEDITLDHISDILIKGSCSDCR